MGDLPGNLLYELGGKYMYQAAAKANVYGISAYLVSELDVVEQLCDDFLSVYAILRTPQSATDLHIEQLRRMEESVFELNLFRGVMAEYLSDCAEAWLDGKTFLNIPKPYVHESVEPVFDAILQRCVWTDASIVQHDLATIVRVYSLLLESGLAEVDQSDYAGLLDCIERNDLIDRLEQVMQKHPFMNDIEFSEISLLVLNGRIEHYPYTSEDYSTLMNHLSNAINTVNSRGYSSQEEKVSVLATNVQKHVRAFGFTISENMSEATAKALLRAFEGYYEVSPSQIEGLLNGFSY